jgi:hypothetical protein
MLAILAFLLYIIHSFYISMEGSLGGGLELKAEIASYVERYVSICSNDQERADLEDLVFTMYMGVDHPQHFLDFVNGFYLTCTSMNDFRKLCSIAADFTNVWQDRTLLNLMNTLVRSGIISRDESGGMKASSVGITRLELLVGYLCDESFIDWFNRNLDEKTDQVAYAKFVEGATNFIELLNWIRDSVSVDPNLLQPFVTVWKTNGVEDCKKLARLFKYYAAELKSGYAFRYASVILRDGYGLVAEKYLQVLAKNPSIDVENLYQGVGIFLTLNDQTGALNFLNLQGTVQ